MKKRDTYNNCRACSCEDGVETCVDCYVEKRLELCPDSYLSSRVMANVGCGYVGGCSRSRRLVRCVVIAVCMAFVILAGLAVGNGVDNFSKPGISLNDSSIESFSAYEFSENDY